MLHLTCLRGKAACLTFDRPGHILLLAETINKLRWPQSWLRKADRQGGSPVPCLGVVEVSGQNGFITALCRQSK